MAAIISFAPFGVLVAAFLVLPCSSRAGSFLRPSAASHLAVDDLAVDGDSMSCSPLNNHGSFSTVTVKIGSPPQTFALVADTGSDDLIVQSCICKASHHCPESFGSCFQGTNKSSTFALDPAPKEVFIRFGSGDIESVLASDIASVGLATALMNNSLLLMVQEALKIEGQFEGILGLGRPHRGATSVLEIGEDRELPGHRRTGQPGTPEHGGPKIEGFLEAANVDRFSMCFNEKTDGVLRLNAPKGTNNMASVGEMHWGLDFQGISIGKKSDPVKFCSPGSKKPGMQSACGIIPDSGTTMIMGPKDQISTLFEDLCSRWPRCQSMHDKLVAKLNMTAAQKINEVPYLVQKEAEESEQLAPTMQDLLDSFHDAYAKANTGDSEMPVPQNYPGAAGQGDYGEMKPDMATAAPTRSSTFQLLLQSCSSWGKSVNLNKEMPSLFFNVAGKEGASDVLELKPEMYVAEMPMEMVHTKRATMFGLPVIEVTKSVEMGCVPTFETMEYETQLNGPVWIFGTPLFYAFQVHYDRLAEPPTIAFLREPCGACVDGHPQVKTAALIGERLETSVTGGYLRRITTESREPKVDTKEPF
ncbi:unnamed protein product [Polarella glacialis]|uniref:Peptidase A1 domain-containing protein n=1 Tax=Polarella glacialis TaxID=89957 RepID=A0A813FZU4_POLGL|nr:unnamed protein product [Polarella glacialis]